ncbi:DUF484 family protein [Flocculibacter collagenilyticus]|uniref:DUF484 family protein n=1 Tax=Flocculibacter collagenilyticus TaxID=2744479 RepID=UPI0018F5315B|nr:DUF484 family protein [Flocculibacter collagenilyticus]
MSEITPPIEPVMQDELSLDASLVKEYLLQHPDFFVQNPDLLAQLRLPHQQKGTISLVERQLEVLREKSQYLEEEITHLMSIARQNEHVFLVFSEIFIRVFDASDQAELLQSIELLISEKLNLNAVQLIKLNEQNASLPDLENKKLTNFIAKRLSHSSTYFGRLSKEEATLFFNDKEVNSVAVLTLGDDMTTGLVAFGSIDHDHFYPGMDTLFINELGRVLTLLLERFDHA